MRGPQARSRLALRLRRLRGRFGIRAQRVTVRPHVSWHWRAAGVVVTGAMMLALAGWIYDAGRRIAGFDRSESSQEIDALRTKVVDFEIEIGKLRTANNASDSSMQIERTAQQQLTARIKMLEADNGRLKEENAVFERLVKGGGRANAMAGRRSRPRGASGEAAPSTSTDDTGR